MLVAAMQIEPLFQVVHVTVFMDVLRISAFKTKVSCVNPPNLKKKTVCIVQNAELYFII